jgi:hypothetical protein
MNFTELGKNINAQKVLIKLIRVESETANENLIHFF